MKLTREMIDATLEKLYNGVLSPPHGTTENPHVTWARGHELHGICGGCGVRLWPQEEVRDDEQE